MITMRDRVFMFVANFAAEHGYAPSMREIGRGVGLSSTSSVSKHIDALEADGRLRSTPGIARSYRVAS